MKQNKYGKQVLDFFAAKSNLIYSIINKVIIKYYSIPISAEDVYLHLIYCFTNVDYETKYYKMKIDIDKFILSQLKYMVHEYCNNFTTKKYMIMNNYISYDTNDDWIIDIECDQKHYVYNELFEFLSNEEFEIIYQLKVLKSKRKDVAKKYNISLTTLRQNEYEIMCKIKKSFL